MVSPTSRFGGHSMTAPLERALVCSPRAAGWSQPERVVRWRELSYQGPPDAAAAGSEHSALCRALEAAGVELAPLPPGGDLTLDALYPRDPSLMTDGGAICLRMAKAARGAEPDHHAAFFDRLGIPILGRLERPATAEAGDLVWLDATTLLAGRSYRTNAAGIEALRQLLGPLAVTVIETPIPHRHGPAQCLHLGSLLSLLTEGVALVDLPWLAVSTLEELRQRGYELIEIDPAERETHAGNVLALGDRRLLALAENPRTNQRLERAGFEVIPVTGWQIGQNGGGGPTCLVGPILRGGASSRGSTVIPSTSGPQGGTARGSPGRR